MSSISSIRLIVYPSRWSLGTVVRKVLTFFKIVWYLLMKVKYSLSEANFPLTGLVAIRVRSEGNLGNSKRHSVLYLRQEGVCT